LQKLQRIKKKPRRATMNNRFRKILGFPIRENKPEPKPEPVEDKPKQKRGKDAK
jgi:hypothetical protein